MAMLTALVHYNGRAIEDDNIENNVPYDGPKQKAMSIKSSFTLEILKKTLHKKLGLRDNEIVGRMAYRIPHAVHYYIAALYRRLLPTAKEHGVYRRLSRR
ncbi:hypothetical protein PIB30_055958, partial [Stylosanthes scabra]|nr:hypothetical protein [Stylosanthes scabra]